MMMERGRLGEYPASGTDGPYDGSLDEDVPDQATAEQGSGAGDHVALSMGLGRIRSGRLCHGVRWRPGIISGKFIESCERCSSCRRKQAQTWDLNIVERNRERRRGGGGPGGERDRETERQRDRETETERDRERQRERLLCGVR
jgi:hypothetical protein